MLAPLPFAVSLQAKPATHEIRAYARHRSRDRAFPRSAIAVGLPPCPPRQADRDPVRRPRQKRNMIVYFLLAEIVWLLHNTGT